MRAIIAGIEARLRTVWPMLIGLIGARTSLIVICTNSYAATDNGLVTNGPDLVFCLLLALAALVIDRTRPHFEPHSFQQILVLCVAISIICTCLLSSCANVPEQNSAFVFGIRCLLTCVLNICILYWLRRMCGFDEVTVALFVSTAFAVSEIIVFLLSSTPPVAQNIVAGILSLIQIACIIPADICLKQRSNRHYRRARTFFTFARSHIQDTRFLTACATGLGLLSLVDGLLRGYPNGTPIPFVPYARFAYTAVTILALMILMVLVIQRRERVMTVVIFVIMGLFAYAALILYGLFPQQLEIGAIATNALNIILCDYCYYITIAFASFGKHRFSFYTMGGWLICFGTRAASRLLSTWLTIPAIDSGVTGVVLGALILLSTQIVLIQFLLAEHEEGISESNAHREEARRTRNKMDLLEKELEYVRQQCSKQSKVTPGALSTTVSTTDSAQEGVRLDTPISPLAPEASPEKAEMISESLRARTRIMGEQFLLTDRELDVLLLYVSGYTQKKVADTLYISQATAHTHIKHIYSKSGMHSRQEILEYLAAWAQ